MVRFVSSPALVRLPRPLLVPAGVPVVVPASLLLLSAGPQLAAVVPVPVGSPLGVADQDQEEGEEEEGEESHDDMNQVSGYWSHTRPEAIQYCQSSIMACILTQQ